MRKDLSLAKLVDLVNRFLPALVLTWDEACHLCLVYKDPSLDAIDSA
jgi:hypothetical protein